MRIPNITIAVAIGFSSVAFIGCESEPVTQPPEPTREPFDVSEGREFLERKEYSEAVEWATNTKKGRPDNVDVQLIHALGELGLQQTDGALEVTTRLINQFQNEPRVVTVHAIVLATQGKIVEAINLLERGLKQHPSNKHIHGALALLYAKENNTEKSETHFIALRKLDPNYDGIPVAGGFDDFLTWIDEHKEQLFSFIEVLIKAGMAVLVLVAQAQ